MPPLGLVRAAYGSSGFPENPEGRLPPEGTLSSFVKVEKSQSRAGVGFELARPLALSVRQVWDREGRRFSPAWDVTWRLSEETDRRPELRLEMDAAFGAARLAGERLIVSKRFSNLDVHAGMGWNRGFSEKSGIGRLPNPLRGVHSRFGKQHSGSEDSYNDPRAWFTGDTIGLLGGAEYATSVSGLSFLAGWKGDRPRAYGGGWSAGVRYRPVRWADLRVSWHEGGSLGGEFVLRTPPLSRWRGRAHPPPPMLPFPEHRPSVKEDKEDNAYLEAIVSAARAEGVVLRGLVRTDAYQIAAILDVDLHRSLPFQAGRAGFHMAEHAPPEVEAFVLYPVRGGIRGDGLRLMRGDLEPVLRGGDGSPQEIWRNLETLPNPSGTLQEIRKEEKTHDSPWQTHIRLETHTSLSNPETGVLSRAVLRAEVRRTGFAGLVVTGMGARVALADNFHRLSAQTVRSPLPVRGDADVFAAHRVLLERSWTGLQHTPARGLHLGMAVGHLEEMYGGIGGAVLYRPPTKSTLAIGGELWQVFKRDPWSAGALGYTGDHVLTGHIDLWYEYPDTDMTVRLSAGRYLAGDFGGSLGVIRRFQNGARLEAGITVTDRASGAWIPDHPRGAGAFPNVRLSLPIGNVRFVPPGTSVETSISPLARDQAQRLDSPIDLYGQTDLFSLRHRVRHWPEIVPASSAQQ